jgi:hypothetical protein
VGLETSGFASLLAATMWAGEGQPGMKVGGPWTSLNARLSVQDHHWAGASRTVSGFGDCFWDPAQMVGDRGTGRDQGRQY